MKTPQAKPQGETDPSPFLASPSSNAKAVFTGSNAWNAVTFQLAPLPDQIAMFITGGVVACEAGGKVVMRAVMTPEQACHLAGVLLASVFDA